MIKANELRLGINIYYDDVFQHGNSPNLKIIKVDSGSIKWAQGNIEQFNRAHKPITLTEEWLLKFGFEKFDEKKNPTHHSRYRLFLCLHYIYVLHYKIKDDIFLAVGTAGEIKYVHQLQNLYFALEGKELTLKTT